MILLVCLLARPKLYVEWRYLICTVSQNLLYHQNRLFNHHIPRSALVESVNRTPLPSIHLVANRKWLLLCAKSLLDDILAIFPELSSVLDTEAVVEHILDLLQTKTRDLGVEEVCTEPLAFVCWKSQRMMNLQMRTHPIPQIAE
jgi:hypothetical protein